ncbi:MAG: methyltransferase [Chitinophagaceae bacterium]|nr:MAG: methyltransferase [Chitinophagaceae bacterium]
MVRQRKPFQGVMNIVRFNWPLYLLSAIVFLLLFSLLFFSTGTFRHLTAIAAFLVFIPVFSSLLVSWYVYDISGLYSFQWLDVLPDLTGKMIVNIHSGFDEFSHVLHQKFPGAVLKVYDFYNPIVHTEASVRRARRMYPAHPGTIQVSTDKLPCVERSARYVFLVFAAHEIRNTEERIVFFGEVRRTLDIAGRVVVIEHLRDFSNFLAYNVGFFHFHKRKQWMSTFRQAGFTVESEVSLNPFIRKFVLQPNGNPA